MPGVAELDGHTAAVTCLAFSSDGTRLVSGERWLPCAAHALHPPALMFPSISKRVQFFLQTATHSQSTAAEAGTRCCRQRICPVAATMLHHAAETVQAVRTAPRGCGTFRHGSRCGL